MGNALSGASVYVCSQPASTTGIPPSPLVQLYSDSAGANPIAQPVLTDGYGHAAYYVTPGTYTVVYYSPQILETILPDQTIGSGNVAFPITIPQGGTNATTAPQALINLGAAARGANADITSLTAIPNTFISTTGYQFGIGTFGSVNTIQLANQTWTGFGFTGFGMGVSSSTQGTLIAPGLIGCSGTITAQLVNSLGLANLGSLRVGTTGPGVIQSFVSGQMLQIGALNSPTSPPPVSVQIESGQPSMISDTGMLGFDQFYPTQSTVGAAGTASAPPANPAIWVQMQVYVAGVATTIVVPGYKKS